MTVRKSIKNVTGLEVRNFKEGETIEMKVERIVNNNEPIEEIAPTIYQPRKDGVRPEYNIRTDRWEIGLDAMNAVERSMIARRENYHASLENSVKEESQRSESTQGTDE